MNTDVNTITKNNPGAMGSVMNNARKTSLMAGILYILTFVSVPTLVLYGPVHERDFITGAGSDTQIIIGGLLEIIVALTGIASAVVLYPVLKRYGGAASLGLVVSRVLEASTIFMGVSFLLAVVTLHTNGEGPTALTASHTLVALYDRIFLLGQGFMPAINDLLLGYLLYKSQLVPRVLSVIGMVGAVPLIAGYLFIMFGWVNQRSPEAGLFAVLVAVFEFSLGIYLIVKGFKPLQDK